MTSATTDVSAIDSLPAGTAADPLPATIVPVDKALFIDLLDPSFGLNLNDANVIAEKIEGPAWGLDLLDGRHVLYVTSDNDLNTALATRSLSLRSILRSSTSRSSSNRYLFIRVDYCHGTSTWERTARRVGPCMTPASGAYSVTSSGGVPQCRRVPGVVCC